MPSDDRLKLTVTVEVDTEDLDSIIEALAERMNEMQKQPTFADRLLNSRETAELLGVSMSSLYSLRYVGNAPPAIKVGQRLRWRRSDIEAWLDGNLERRPHQPW